MLGGLFSCSIRMSGSFILYSLGNDQVFICSVLMEQIIMGTLFDDFLILYNDDAIGMFNCR
jgi:hypothetical protein